ncbi:MAG: hypothetical protein R2752_05585 [Vicinamibacterales bacterium]
MPRRISSASSLDTFRKEARRWLKALRQHEAQADERLRRAWPDAPPEPTLRDVQHALAREYGHESWIALKAAIGAGSPAVPPPLLTAEGYDRLAADFVQAHNATDAAALERLNAHYRRAFTVDDLGAEIWRRVYAFRQRVHRTGQRDVQPDEVRVVIAQDAGFGSWNALLDAVATGRPPVPPFAIDETESLAAPRRQVSDGEWTRLVALMRERRLSRFSSNGLMTDAVLEQVATLGHVTRLDLGGSRQVTDAGLRHLAKMPQLEHLTLGGVTMTDRGLEVLRELPNLRTLELSWQRGISDAGLVHLRACERLEAVDLIGTATGDAAIEALQGKAHLHRLSTGRLVTDAGLTLLPNIPLFGEAPTGAADAREHHLLVDGPFSDAGLAQLAGLAGVNHLDLFWHVTHVTSDGFAHLARMPNLLMLGMDGRLSDDRAFEHVSAIPRLRHLRAQEAAATDAGFEALARSRTLEGFWGRECDGFGSRAFRAFATMPALRSLGVGLGQVDDASLSRLPAFPALRELTPIGLTDDGFRHVGRCVKLERLTCMYCRQTTDASTGRIAGLDALRYYYAGLTGITDRSLEILGGLPALEQAEFYECQGITNAGLVHLARAPKLREVALDSLPGVTLDGTRVFPKGVRVRYST